MRLTRTRYQSDDRPRIPSTSTSAGSRWSPTPGWRAFQRSSPSSASAFDAAREISMTGIDRLAPTGRRRSRALPFGRQAGVRIAGGDGRRSFRGHLGRGTAGLAATLSYSESGGACATAGRAAARRPASRSSAATGRRPRPSRLVLRPTARAAPRATRPRRRCRRPGRRSPRSRAGTVAIVNASASTVGTSSQAQRRRDPRVRQRPDRSRPTRPSGPWRSGCSRGRRRGAPPSTTSRSRDPARAARRRGPAPAPPDGPPDTSSAARCGR